MMHFSGVLIICIVTACAHQLSHCTSSAEERKKADHEAKVTELKVLKDYNTGYMNTDAFAHSTATTEEIQNEIDRLYHQLKCSCLFHAQVHMKLTENLLRNGGILENRTDDVWYEEIVIQMINIFLAANNDVPINEIWMLYAYTYDVKSCFRLSRSSTVSAWIQKKNDVMTMHDFVLKSVEEFTETECDQASSFNVKPEHSEATTLDKSSQNVQDSSPDLLTFRKISKHKNTINRLLIKNMLKNNRVKQHFDYNTLFFNTCIDFDETINYLVTIFTGTMSWKGAREKLYNANYTARTALGLTSITYLGRYQSAFIDLLKAITLQILWKHMMYLNQISAQTLSENSIEFITKIEQLLVKFSNLVGLNQDDSIKNVIKFFRSQRFTVEDANNVIDDIAQELMVISKTLEFDVTQPTNLDTDTNSESFNKIQVFANAQLGIGYYLNRHNPINDTILTLEILVTFLEVKFENNHVFKAVRSFNKMTKDVEEKITHFLMPELK